MFYSAHPSLLVGLVSFHKFVNHLALLFPFLSSVNPPTTVFCLCYHWVTFLINSYLLSTYHGYEPFVILYVT